MKLLASALLALPLVACGGSSKPVAAPAPAQPASAPAAPVQAKGSCDQTVANMMSLQGGDLFAEASPEKRQVWKDKFVAILVTACTEDRWSPEVLACAADAVDSAAMDACGEHLDKDAEMKLMERVQPFMAELTKEIADSAPKPESRPEPKPQVSSSGKTGVPECDVYAATLELYATCDKVPAPAREASKQSFEALQQSFAQSREPGAPDQARKALVDGCVAGRETLVQSAQALGCNMTPPAPAQKPKKKKRAAR